MEQKTPNISDKDIKRIIARDFSQSDFRTIVGILKMYKSDSTKGNNRIYASILKLSDGNIGLLREYIDKANNDYRDVIALAEYPNYSKNAFDNALSDQKKNHLINSDWAQYELWFNKK